MSATPQPVIKTTGTVTSVRVSGGDTLHIVLTPANGKKVIARGAAPKCPLGKIRRPRKGTAIQVRGKVETEGSITVVLADAKFEL